MLKKKKIRDFPGGPVVKLHASKQGACVQPVSHSLCCTARKKKLMPQILMA